MEKKVDLPYMMSFENLYDWFLTEKKKYQDGTLLFSYFNGTYVDSSMSEDELYIAYYGKTKKEELEERLREKIEHEQMCERMKMETEALKEEHRRWVESNYGSEEAYKKSLIDKYYSAGTSIIPQEKHNDWKETVSANIDNIGILEESIYYIKCLNKDEKPRARFGELKQYFDNKKHSGATANFVLNVIEYYCGEIGEEFSSYIRKY